MGMVDWTFYSTVYMGNDVDEASFPSLCVRAEDIIGAMTRWADETAISRLPAAYQTLYKKAVCAQIDFLSINGVDSVNETESAGFTVGKVTVHGKTSVSAGGKMAGNISPMAISYLEQTGLLYPGVPTCDGWW